MMITRTSTGEGLPAAEANGVCFISGVPALDPDGVFQAGTFDEETSLAWRNVIAIASAAGFSQEEIVYVQCVLADIDDYANIKAWWRWQFPDVSAAPARFTFQAGALPFGAKIEIQAVAARGN